jgi:hypothetical protein
MFRADTKAFDATQQWERVVEATSARRSAWQSTGSTDIAGPAAWRSAE